jgi:hypothetical protein
MANKSKHKRTLTDLVVDRYVNLELFYRNQAPGANGCINWTGVQNNIGYGFIGFRNIDPATGEPIGGDGGMMTAHRLAFMIDQKRLPTKRNVNHTCHNKLCVNPAHLTEGTQRDKLNDMKRDGIKGGRAVGSGGYAYNHEQTGRKYKYSKEEIQWVRSADPSEVAERYGITRSKATTKQHAFRKGYRWLPLPEVK